MSAPPPDPHDPAIADTSADVSEPRGKAPRQVRAGDRLGRYDLGDELGEGGMATVFRARDRELRRDVAVKVLFPHLARRPEVVHRFHREARAAAGLEHPNILRIYDVGGGEDDDPPYIVMELIRGRTLLHEIDQRGAMLAEIAACIGAVLGDALAAAHAAGVIHRDVKPANVLIAPGGRLLLADFGVARLETEDSLVTRTGALLGTPAYMSPEQANGDVTAARSDLYSLGATLYQLATGGLPYGGSPAKVISQIAAGNLVPPVRRRPSCGPDLSRLIERAMAVDPARRPPSAAAMAADLRALATAGGLGDPLEELAAYFEDAEGFLKTRTPTVVTALVTSARTAVAEARLPRAMALADRASALAPDDPTVTALIQTLTEGGRASQRMRRIAIAGIAVALVGGIAALSWRLTSSPSADSLDASLAGPPLALAADGTAEPPASETRPPVPSPAELPDDPPGEPPAESGAAAPTTPPSDAGTAPASDARMSPVPTVREPASRRPRDAAVAPPSLDAAPEIEAPPAPPQPPPPAKLDAAVEPASAIGYIVVKNDIWCDISIDGTARGNVRNQALKVSAGHHVVRCANPAHTWTQETDVAPGATRTLIGTLPDIAVTLALDAVIDGKRHARGSVVKLKPRRVEVIAGGKRVFITFRISCTLRDSPELDCYQ